MDPRPCSVTDPQTNTKRDAYFYGVFQRAYTQAAILVGEVSGQIAYPVGVVEYSDTKKMDSIFVNYITFSD